MRMYQRLAACCLAAVLCFLGGCQQGPETVSSNLESQETAHPLLSKAPRVETAPVDSLSLEELRDPEQGFIYPGLAYGMSPQEAFAALDRDESATPGETYTDPDSGRVSATYQAGSVAIQGESFSLSLEFRDEELAACSLRLDPLPDRDCTALCQGVFQTLMDLYGLEAQDSGLAVAAQEDSSQLQQYDMEGYLASCAAEDGSQTALKLYVYHKGDVTKGMDLLLLQRPSGEQEEQSGESQAQGEELSGQVSFPAEAGGTDSLSLEDLLDETGAFAYPGIPYGMSLEQLAVLTGGSLEPVSRSSQEDAPVRCPLGDVELLGHSFQRELEFQDGLYTACVLSAEGQDLTSLYQDLYRQLDTLYALGEETVLEDVSVARPNGTMERYDKNRFASVSQREGNTGLFLFCLEREGAVVRVELELFCGE